jgi:hypothetical protein
MATLFIMVAPAATWLKATWLKARAQILLDLNS